MGVTSYRTNIPAVIKALHKGASDGVIAVANKLEDQASEDCPDDTGFLRASIYQLSSTYNTRNAAGSVPPGKTSDYTTEPPAPPTSDQEVILAYAAFYGLWVHEGTRRMAGNPWFLSAMTSIQGSVANTVAQEIGSALVDAALPDNE